jgi:hypothetical protein
MPRTTSAPPRFTPPRYNPGMRYFLSGLLTAAWGLWFGGLVALFVFIQRLFESMQDEKYRPIFDAVAPAQFSTAERLGLIVGAIALLAAFGLQLLLRRRETTWLFVVLAFAAMIEVARPALISRRMLPLIEAGQTRSPEFLNLHKYYMMIASLEAVILLIAAFALPALMKALPRAESAAADAPP